MRSGDSWELSGLGSGHLGVLRALGKSDGSYALLLSLHLCPWTYVPIDLQVLKEGLKRLAQRRHGELPLLPGDTPPSLRTAPHTPGRHPRGQVGTTCPCLWAHWQHSDFDWAHMAEGGPGRHKAAPAGSGGWWS